MNPEISWSISWFSSCIINSMSCSKRVLGYELLLFLILRNINDLSLWSVFDFSATLLGDWFFSLITLCHFLLSTSTHSSTFVGAATTVTSHALWDREWFSTTWVVRIFFLLETDLVSRLGFLGVSCRPSFREWEPQETSSLQLIFRTDLFEVEPSSFDPCKSINTALVLRWIYINL